MADRAGVGSFESPLEQFRFSLNAELLQLYVFFAIPAARPQSILAGIALAEQGT